MILLENLAQYSGIIKWILIIVVVIVGVLWIKKLVKNTKRAIRRTVRQVTQPLNNTMNTMHLINEMAKAAEEMPDPKSVGGMTSIYLKEIHKDYPEYHNSDAENEIRDFLNEYLEVKYSGKTEFTKYNKSDKINIYVDKQPKGSLTGIRHNGIAIYNYKKTREYATVTYRASVGFNYNSKRIETRYEVDYTIQLIDDNITSVSLKCPNCGGTYSSLRDTECPYCGAGIIRDTIMNWSITNCKEIL